MKWGGRRGCTFLSPGLWHLWGCCDTHGEGHGTHGVALPTCLVYLYVFSTLLVNNSSRRENNPQPWCVTVLQGAAWWGGRRGGLRGDGVPGGFPRVGTNVVPAQGGGRAQPRPWGHPWGPWSCGSWLGRPRAGRVSVGGSHSCCLRGASLRLGRTGPATPSPGSSCVPQVLLFLPRVAPVSPPRPCHPQGVTLQGHSITPPAVPAVPGSATPRAAPVPPRVFLSPPSVPITPVPGCPCVPRATLFPPRPYFLLLPRPPAPLRQSARRLRSLVQSRRRGWAPSSPPSLRAHQSQPPLTSASANSCLLRAAPIGARPRRSR